MFTGIIRHIVPVAAVERKEDSMRLTLAFCEELLIDLQLGASIAVDGACLTVVNIDGTLVSFDILGETLSRTTLGQLENRSRVHVERSAKFGDEIGGHFVSGHVYGKGKISALQQRHADYILTCQVEPSWMKYILVKGSIAIDGVSLTLVTTAPSGHFTVHLIPETLRLTKLGSKGIDDTVNIEIDGQAKAIVDTVERYLQINPAV